MISAILKGERLPCPRHLSQEIYTDILLPCWREQPDQRPSFSSLLAKLGCHMGERRLAEWEEMNRLYMSRLPLLHRNRDKVPDDPPCPNYIPVPQIHIRN